MDDHQDDAYAARRADLDAQFQALPPAGSGEYWRRIEQPEDGQDLPLEVLARCCRERIAASVLGDAHRVFNVIMRRIQASTRQWAWKIAGRAKADATAQHREDLEQECHMKLWEELSGEGPTFLLENFAHKLEMIRKHVAHSDMEKAGEWKRPGVVKPTRIPRGEMVSLQREAERDDDPPRNTTQLADPSAQDALDLAEYSDLFQHIHDLPADQRKIIHDRYFLERTQEETAADLGITSRTIRKKLPAILRDLRAWHQGDEEDDHV